MIVGGIILLSRKLIPLIFIVFLLLGCSDQENVNNQETLEPGQAEVVGIHPSNPSLFTQGLELTADDNLLVSTGLYDQSKLGYLNIENGQFQEIDSLPGEYFGEGITQTEDYLWQVTWQENTAIKRNLNTYDFIEEVPYQGEGWGIAYDPEKDLIYMSNGSDEIQMRNSETFELIDTFNVTADGKPVDKLNELEYANGNLYSNVWYEDVILEIELQSGEVQTVYDLSSIIKNLGLTQAQRDQMDSLNGIAHIEENRFYITGKLYPFVLEVKFH